MDRPGRAVLRDLAGGSSERQSYFLRDCLGSGRDSFGGWGLTLGGLGWGHEGGPSSHRLGCHARAYNV